MVRGEIRSGLERTWMVVGGMKQGEKSNMQLMKPGVVVGLGRERFENQFLRFFFLFYVLWFTSSACFFILFSGSK